MPYAAAADGTASREIDHPRRCGGEHLGPVGARRINPDGVDVALGRLGLVSGLFQLRIPSPREDRARSAEIEAHHVGLLMISLRRQAQQIGGRVVAGEGAEPDRELTGHRSNVAQVIGGDLGGIAGRKHIHDARHAQVAIDDQAAQIVARRGNLRGQRATRAFLPSRSQWRSRCARRWTASRRFRPRP